jgi:hypothetical protein
MIVIAKTRASVGKHSELVINKVTLELTRNSKKKERKRQKSSVKKDKIVKT